MAKQVDPPTALEGFKAALGAVTTVLDTLRDSLNKVVATAAHFVQALNPQIVAALNQEMRNLNATIGVGLVPIVQQARLALREWAGLLLPAMREIRPIVDRLAGSVSGLLSGGVRGFATVLEAAARAVAPFVDKIAGIIDAYGQQIETVLALTEAIVETTDWLRDVLKSVLGGLGGLIGVDVLGSFRDHIATVTRAMAVLTARILQLVGAGDTVKRFQERLAKVIEDRAHPRGGAIAAPTDVGTSGIEDIARRIGERAFASSGGGPAKRGTDDILLEIEKDLKAVIADPISWEQLIRSAIESAMPEWLKTGPPIQVLSEATREAVKDVATNPVAAGAAIAVGGPTAAAGLALLGEVLR